MTTLNTIPRADGFRMPAEWEPHAQTWMLWPERPDNWRLGAKPAQAAFVAVAHAIARFEPVTVGVSAAQYENACARLAHPAIRVLELSSDDAWVRDTGPTFVVDDAGRVRGVDWTFNAWGGFGGEVLIEDMFAQLPGGVLGAFFVVMLVIFLLGFILDFIEITFVVVPIVGPVLLAMGLDPVWLGVMIALNLQTSFLTPPFGFSLFYLRGVTPRSVPTSVMYKGVLPFILIQALMLVIAYVWPGLITWLPEVVYGK